jgi:hypothetical protein
VTRSTENRFRRVDLAHGVDHVLVPSATFRDDAGSSFTATFGTEVALRAFLDMVSRYPGTTSTVTMFLKPRGYKPAPSAPPEFVPSSLYFDLDQASGIAAAALLLVDATGLSHQWLTQGDLGRGDITLVADPHNPEYATFPHESLLPVSMLRDAVLQWAFGDDLPPTSVAWRPATEDEVGWPVGAGY